MMYSAYKPSPSTSSPRAATEQEAVDDALAAVDDVERMHVFAQVAGIKDRAPEFAAMVEGGRGSAIEQSFALWLKLTHCADMAGEARAEALRHFRRAHPHLPAGQDAKALACAKKLRKRAAAARQTLDALAIRHRLKEEVDEAKAARVAAAREANLADYAKLTPAQNTERRKDRERLVLSLVDAASEPWLKHVAAARATGTLTTGTGTIRLTQPGEPLLLHLTVPGEAEFADSPVWTPKEAFLSASDVRTLVERSEGPDRDFWTGVEAKLQACPDGAFVCLAEIRNDKVVASEDATRWALFEFTAAPSVCPPLCPGHASPVYLLGSPEVHVRCGCPALFCSDACKAAHVCK